jgi:hypothetical protein
MPYPLLIMKSKVLYLNLKFDRNRDSVVGIATGYGLDDRGGRGSSFGNVKNFLHDVHSGSRAHPAFYPMGTGGKAAGA